VGYMSYGFTHHNWGWQAIWCGLASAAIAEGCYLTLGGGAGCADLWNGAGYAATYAGTSTMEMIENRDQIGHASRWGAFGLIEGYSFLSAVETGFQYDGVEGGNENDYSLLSSVETDNNGTGYMDAKIDEMFYIDHNGLWGGAISYGIGGAIYNGGNTVLQSYNSENNKWQFDAGKIGRNTLEGLVSSGVSKIVSNGFDAYFGGKATLNDKKYGSYSAIMASKAVSIAAVNQATTNVFEHKSDGFWNFDAGSEGAFQWVSDMISIFF